MTEAQVERLRYGRQSAGHTQKSAAQALNVEYSTYRKWESGTNEPSSIEKLGEVCRLFDISIDWLVYGEQKESPPKNAALVNELGHLSSETIHLISAALKSFERDKSL